jgi:hypothetical protein
MTSFMTYFKKYVMKTSNTYAIMAILALVGIKLKIAKLRRFFSAISIMMPE